ncbi:hypothetical protein [Aquisphaera insulae]|uniref:hypothetical protein n=1 Tax=Aquisphaera insulae TaxID=2712864 RepID=UPI0013EB66C6|nr:hypothetical protein [Aquisphaera insulae]
MLGKILVIAVRVTALAAMFGAGVAILVSPPTSEPRWRHATAVPPAMILPRSLTDRAGIEPQVLHPDTPRVEPLAPMLPGGISLDLASFSPWEDRGRRQIVGVAWSRGGLDASGPEMIRMVLPDGQILDRIPLLGDPLPNDAPCWLPGNRARVVYPGADGRVYGLDFEAGWAGGSSDQPSGIRPRELPWQPSPIADATPFVGDLSWDEDDPSGRRMLASVQFRGGGAGIPTDWQLWWLELDRGTTRIVAAGRLLDAEETGLMVRRRHPRIFRGGDGSPRLAYVATRMREMTNELRVATLHVAAGSAIPRASEAEAKVVASGILLAPPAIAPDRRSVAVLRAAGRSVEAVRVPAGWDIARCASVPDVHSPREPVPSAPTAQTRGPSTTF